MASKTQHNASASISELLKRPLLEANKGFRSFFSSFTYTEDEETKPNSRDKSRYEIDVTVTTTFWDNFRRDVTLHKDVRYKKLIVKNKSYELDSPDIDGRGSVKFAFEHVLKMAASLVGKNGEVFANPNSSAHVTRGLKPDFLFMNSSLDKEEIYFVVEARKKRDIELKKDEKMSDLCNSRLRSATNAKKIVRQVYLYMAELNLKYGVLTTYYQTWFFKLDIDKNILSISETFDYNSITPTILENLAFMMHLSRQNRVVVTKYSFLSRFDSKSKRNYHVEVSNNKSKRIKRDLGDVEDKITLGQLYIGGTEMANTIAGKCGSLEFIMKICDKLKDPDVYQRMKNEVEIYTNYLPEIQGKVIAKFYFSWEDETRFGFSMSDMGKTADLWSINTSNRTKLFTGLSEIHKFGVKHEDVGMPNILKNENGDFFYDNFEHAVADCIKDELDEEMNFFVEMLEHVRDDDEYDECEDSYDSQDGDEYDDDSDESQCQILPRILNYFESS